MFEKILIANRGEIACRVIRTAKKLGIRTVAVYSDADKNSLHVAMADEAVHIGPAPSRESYLVAEKIIAAAIKTGAQAIHPGYGFLSENAQFCALCKSNNIVFIGPPVAAIEAMGSKSAAKTIMEAAGVPLVPGYHGDDQNPAILKNISDQMGYPVLLKAAAGGGGKGMRQVWSAAEFDAGLAAAKREAMSSFGDDKMLVEKYLTQPRHVEIQVFCDSLGNGVYLFERDCSVQRRHQKVIEEAPAPGLNETVRTAMGDAALLAARTIAYEGAGTVEFLLDKDDSFYFMEMNARLQVEHPVTEMITGQDLVEWQLRVAAGQPLPLRQEQLTINGHAFEARIYAEDPNNDFLPSTGKLDFLRPPSEDAHVRVDTGVLQGDEVSPYYDPMIAKLVVWDENRDRALARLARALTEYRISGVTTNVDFLYNLATNPAFKAADLDTGFIEKHREEIFRPAGQDMQQGVAIATLFMILHRQQAAATLAQKSTDPTSPWHGANGWRCNEPRVQKFDLLVADVPHRVLASEHNPSGSNRYTIISDTDDHGMIVSGTLKNHEIVANMNGHRVRATVVAHGQGHSLFTAKGALPFSLVSVDCGDGSDVEAAGGLTAPMTGTVVSLVATVGTTVAKGDPLLIMEAMKMEHTIRAPKTGMVTEFYFTPGDLVDGGVAMLSFEASNDA